MRRIFVNSSVFDTFICLHNVVKAACEWNVMADDLATKVYTCEKEREIYYTELSRLKCELDEIMAQLELVKIENKRIINEVIDIIDKLQMSAKLIHEFDKQRRRLDVETEELQTALEKAEVALE